MLSVPRHPILSIFVEGGSLSTIGYEIHHLEKITEDLNVFDCILTDASGSWVYTFNHEWQSGQHPLVSLWDSGDAAGRIFES